MKTVIYGGHLSRFGFECIKAILASDYFLVDTIVIADLDRWIHFYKKLKKGQQNINSRKTAKTYRQKTKALKELAAKKVISIRVIPNANTVEEYSFLKGYELALSAAFPQIFSEAFTQSPKKGAINFHPSYLPRCRGANPIYWTIASREKFGGISCHFMTKELDKGPIAVREKILFNQNQITFESLYQKILDHLPGLITKLELFFRESQKPLAQDESVASYFTENLDKDHRIYWEAENYELIDAKIRAGNAFTTYKSCKLLLSPSSFFHKNIPFKISSDFTNAKRGTLIFIDSKSLWVKIEGGYLQTTYLIPVSGIRWLQRLMLYPLIKKYKIYRFGLSTGVVFE